MKDKSSAIWLDLETGGIDPAQSSILSAAWGEAGNIKTKYAQPIPGTFLSDFSSQHIIPQLKNAPALDMGTEHGVIKSLIESMEAQPHSPIAGFNIRGFDFGFIQKRARGYGLEERFTKTLAGRQIIDPIHQVKGIISGSILEHARAGLFNEDLGVSSWSEATDKFSPLPFKQRPTEFNLLSSIEGYVKAGRDKSQFKGWKLEDINKLIEMHSGTPTLAGGVAHEAAADLVMSKRVVEAAKSGELSAAFQKPEIAKAWMNITKSRGYHQFGGGKTVGPEDIIHSPGMTSLKTGIKSHWKMLGVGAAAVLAAAVISGRDDDYNTIEGLRHGNLAQSKRLELTSFGSGWQGLPVDQRILDFKKKWSDPDERRSIQKIIEEEEAKSLANLDSFRDGDIRKTAAKFDLSSKDSAFKVDLSNFKVSAEDADTLILKRKGLLNIFSNPIQIRVAGIDAPEIGSHAGDPLSFIRFSQEQPFGKEASERLGSIIDDADDLSLYVTGEKTYGRYVGSLQADGKNAARTLVEEGLVTALPFGKKSADLVDRDALNLVQEQAREDNVGLWKLKRYKAIDETNKKLKNPITYNTLTRLDKLASSEVLSRYATKLDALNVEGNLSVAESSTFAQMGRSIAAFFKPRMSGKDDAHNVIQGLGHRGIGQYKRKELTEFGSGWQGIKNFISSFRGLSDVKQVKRLGTVENWGQVFEMSGLFRGRATSFVRKQGFIGENEVSALEAASRAGLAPRILGKSDKTLDMAKLGGRSLEEMSGQEVEKLLPALESSVRNLHRTGYSHGDLHLGNVFLEKGKIKFIDFGDAQKSNPVNLNKDLTDLIESAKAHAKWNRVPGKDDAHNTIEGLGHKGIGQKLRKLLTPFGSGWRGIINLSNKMDLGKFSKSSGAAGDIYKFQEIWQSNVTSLKALHGNNWWKTEAGKATHQFGKELIEAKEAGFTHVAAINTENIRAQSVKAGVSYGKMLKHTIEHERTHLGLRLQGAAVGKTLPVPTAFRAEMAKNAAYKNIAPEMLAEEYVANFAAVSKYPERAKIDSRVRSAILGASTEELARAEALSKGIAQKLKIQRKKNMIAFNQKKALGQTWQAGIDAGRRSKMG